MVVIETSKGNITLELYKDKAPKTVENFLEYVNAGYYNGTIFHRVIQGFMIRVEASLRAWFKNPGSEIPIVNEYRTV
jgi:cyclophilin family peptidyl-prolyl cis-trans isomerase